MVARAPVAGRGALDPGAHARPVRRRGSATRKRSSPDAFPPGPPGPSGPSGTSAQIRHSSSDQRIRALAGSSSQLPMRAMRCAVVRLRSFSASASTARLARSM